MIGNLNDSISGSDRLTMEHLKIRHLIELCGGVDEFRKRTPKVVQLMRKAQEYYREMFGSRVLGTRKEEANIQEQVICKRKDAGKARDNTVLDQMINQPVFRTNHVDESDLPLVDTGADARAHHLTAIIYSSGITDTDGSVLKEDVEFAPKTKIQRIEWSHDPPPQSVLLSSETKNFNPVVFNSGLFSALLHAPKILILPPNLALYHALKMGISAAQHLVQMSIYQQHTDTESSSGYKYSLLVRNESWNSWLTRKSYYLGLPELVQSAIDTHEWPVEKRDGSFGGVAQLLICGPGEPLKSMGENFKWRGRIWNVTEAMNF